ncbi:hypothetical protein UlMin_026656 [Ulmus minor]
MKKALYLLLLLQFTFIFTFSEAESNTPQPHAAGSFNITNIQNAASCSYTVVISTSCSSVRYTRDQISIAFGDGYGNQIYAPRLDDPSTRTFERCSSDTFQISGPCAYQICYAYLYRTGPDGWKPDSVNIYGYNSRTVSFYYNVFVPADTWYGFNYCSTASSTNQRFSRRWCFMAIIVLLFTLL